MGWYYYLEEKTQFPFKATCVQQRDLFPLRIGETVTVIGMVSEEECMAEMFVEIEWAGRSFGVPLAQLQGVKVDSETEEAIADWRY